MELLDPENECGRSLLILVAEGNSRLAQLQALATHLPKMLLKQGNSKFEQVLLDFSFFTSIQAEQDRLKADPYLSELDQTLKKEYLPVFQRYFDYFQAVIKYYQDLHELIREINVQVFKQYSLELLFGNLDGQQLLCEALHLYCVQLLLTDILLPGPVRERIIVAIYRYKGGDARVPGFSSVKRLFRDTGFGMGRPRPKGYPQNYFSRLEVDQDLVRRVITAILEKDIYLGLPIYPRHPSVALSAQGAILFTALFLRPDLLNDQDTRLRQIVDKHFYDCWVISFYLGYTVDLTEWWKPYKAARNALDNILDLQKIESRAALIRKQLLLATQKCEELLAEDVLGEEFVLERLGQLLQCLRSGNVTIRWQMLHRRTTHKKVLAIIEANSDSKEIVSLLLKLSQYEHRLKTALESLLEQKGELWKVDQESTVQLLADLGQYFGARTGKIQGAEAVRDWFVEMSKLVSNLSDYNQTFTTRKLKDWVRALEDVQNKIPTNLHVKESLEKARGGLSHMRKLKALGDNVLEQVAQISDMTWGWQSLREYIPTLREFVRNEPGVSLLLKNLFVKTASILETPIERIVEADSPNLGPVSKFYSGELVKLVQDVLQGIPGSVFDSIQKLSMFANDVKPVPAKFQREKLKEYAQFDLRRQISGWIARITVLAESVLTMEKYLIGVAEVRPKELLEQGLRRELLLLIAQRLDSLKFGQNSPEEFKSRVQLLACEMQHLKHELVRVQDYLRTSGLNIFNEQYSRLIKCYSRIEASCLRSGQVLFQELEEEDDLPLPDKKQGVATFTFLGRLLQAIRCLTEARRCWFNRSACCFFNNSKQVFSFKTLALLEKTLQPEGFIGMAELLNTSIQLQLSKLYKLFSTRPLQLFVQTILQMQKEKFYQSLLMLRAQQASVGQLLAQMNRVGQLCLLSGMFKNAIELNMKRKNGLLFSAIRRVDQAVSSELQHVNFTLQQEPLLKSVVQLARGIGLYDPFQIPYLQQKHVTIDPESLLGLLILCVSLSQYDSKRKNLVRKGKVQFEPSYFITAVGVVLQQKCLADWPALCVLFTKYTLRLLQSQRTEATNEAVLLSTYVVWIAGLVRRENPKIADQLLQLSK